MKVIHTGQIVALVSLWLVMAGCSTPVDPRIAELQKKFVLPNPPDGERTVSSVRKLFLEPEDPASVPTEVEVVIRGRIHNGKLPPWESGKTAFMLTDATGHSGESDHDPHTCPFCSRHIEDYMAEISFRDESGKLHEIDSREAFGLKEGQLLLIEGTARLEDDILKVDASGLHFAKPKPNPVHKADPEPVADETPSIDGATP